MVAAMVNNSDGDKFEPTNPLGPNARRNLSKSYKFTAEEVRVLKECNRESFYYRCLPFSGLLGGCTYYAVKSGFLSPNQRYGATPKVIVSVIVGYFLGKFSYQYKCAEKLMQLPNSQIGEILRQKRRGNIQETFDSGFGPAMSLAPFSGVNSTDMYSDLNPNNSLDIDTTRPDTPGLDDYQRPSVDNPLCEEEMPPEQKHTTTYDQLRKQNREEYYQKRVADYKESTKPIFPPDSPPPVQNQKDSEQRSSVTKNKYGDVWGQ